jgi:hypothetical protein
MDGSIEQDVEGGRSETETPFIAVAKNLRLCNSYLNAGQFSSMQRYQKWFAAGRQA